MLCLNRRTFDTVFSTHEVLKLPLLIKLIFRNLETTLFHLLAFKLLKLPSFFLKKNCKKKEKKFRSRLHENFNSKK